MGKNNLNIGMAYNALWMVFDKKPIDPTQRTKKALKRKKKRAWATFKLNTSTNEVDEIFYYAPSISEQRGCDVSREFIATTFAISPNVRQFVVIDGSDGRHVIQVSDFFENKQLYRKHVAKLEENIDKIIEINDGKPHLKFKVVSIDDNSPRVVYGVFANLKNKENKKRKKLLANVYCDTETERIEEIHYHPRYIKRLVNGLELVRQCIADNEWEIDADTKEVASFNGSVLNKETKKWERIKKIVPLSECKVLN